VAAEFDKLTPDAKHVIGNHCLAVPREVLLKRLGIPRCGYYRTEAAHGWRLLVLDTTELSGHWGFPEVKGGG